MPPDPLPASCSRLQEWGDQIALLSSKAAAADAQCESACRALDALKPGVHALFQRLGSPDPALADALSSAGVTEGNLMQHMGCIEQRVHAVVHMHEMASAGVPLSLPLQEAELSAAGRRSGPSPGPPAPPSNGALQPQAGAAAGAPSGPDTGVPVDVPISRVGGVGGIGSPAYAYAADAQSARAGGGAGGAEPWRMQAGAGTGMGMGMGPTARTRRAIIAPSLRDLEEDSEDSDDGAGTGTMTRHGGRRASRAGSRATGGDLAAGVGAPGAAVPARLGDAALSAAPLDPAVLRAHTIALVESKQARAAARERMAPERPAYGAASEGPALALGLRVQADGHEAALSPHPASASGAAASGALGIGRDATPGSAGGRRRSVVVEGTSGAQQSALPVTSPIAQHAPADAATTVGVSAPELAAGGEEVASGAPSPTPAGQGTQRVPRPPTEPSVRSSAVRPGAARSFASVQR